MLPSEVRLRKSLEISQTLKAGKRYPAKFLVFHIAPGKTSQTRFAFAVGKNVGNSVVRHKVVRRLRHLVMANYVKFPTSSDVVVRALPGIETTSPQELQNNFDQALAKVGTR
jgi:ribonuclease P protein component